MAAQQIGDRRRQGREVEFTAQPQRHRDIVDRRGGAAGFDGELVEEPHAALSRGQGDAVRARARDQGVPRRG
ncbi:hypothetical protein FMUBM48_49460 [Nocardia cyriacigeorgica]|nr:hypothetical protein FMUBM48_49460 [Nocardia cyriacigeorgica]